MAQPDRSVKLSLSQLMARTGLSCPTVIDGLERLEAVGLVVSTTRERGKVKTYYVPDPPDRRGPAGLDRENKGCGESGLYCR